MKISIAKLRRMAGPFEVIAHSMEGSLYSVGVVVEGREHRLVGDNGKTVQGRSILQVKENLEGVGVAKLSLRQSSAYDEMIGQGPRESANTLEVAVALDNEV